jgi:hypothetical protein
MCPLPRRPAGPASSEHGAHHPAQTAEQKGDCALQSTNTTTNETEFVIQPELILFLSSHWEVKAGVPLGVTSTAPRAGFKFQVAWIFGGSD